MLLHAYYVRDPRVQRAAHALRDAGWTVKVICLNEGDEPTSEIIDDVQVLRCPVSRSQNRTRFRFILEYGSFMLRSFIKLWREDRHERHDVVIVHNMPNALVFSTLPVRIRGCPVILDLHDASPEVFANHFGVKSPLFNKLLMLEETLAMKYSSALITVNRGIEAVFTKRHPWAEFLVVHNSSAAQDSTSPGNPVLEKQGELHAVFHGHLHERYGLQRFIRVLPQLAADGMTVTLDVHGDGPFRDPLEALVEELGLADSVRFHGAFTPGDLPDILADKHLGVALHVRNELGDLLLPVKILEYAEAGIPIVSSRLATVQSYFPDNCANYCDSDEELLRCMKEIRDDYATALCRADRAKKIAKLISWEHDSAMLVDYVDATCSTR